MAFEYGDRLVGAEGVQEAQRLAEYPKVMEGELGGVVHVLVIVDDQHLPACLGRPDGLRLGGIFNKGQMIVVVHDATRMMGRCYPTRSMAASPAKTKSPAGLFLLPVG